jgi:CRISPR-associated protein Csm1
MNILIETRGKRFNLAHFAYAVARMETKDDSKKESSRKLRNQFYEWALTPKDRKQMITALQLLIYRMRDK